MTSSISKSGSSATTSAGERPAARRSRTSLTRMRMPRTHGRPPHCCGLIVIRSVGVPASSGSQFERLSLNFLADESLLCQLPICFENQLDGLAKILSHLVERLALAISAGDLLDKSDVALRHWHEDSSKCQRSTSGCSGQVRRPESKIPDDGTPVQTPVASGFWWENDRDQRLAILREPLRPILPRVRCKALFASPRRYVAGEERASSLPSNTASSSLSLAINFRIPAFVNPFSPIG